RGSVGIADEGALIDKHEPLVDRRRLERALVTKLGIREEIARVPPRALADLLRRRQLAVHVDHSLDGVDLGARHIGREPDAVHWNAALPGGLDHLVARLARWIGVVENDQ